MVAENRTSSKDKAAQEKSVTPLCYDPTSRSVPVPYWWPAGELKLKENPYDLAAGECRLHSSDLRLGKMNLMQIQAFSPDERAGAPP